MTIDSVVVSCLCTKDNSIVSTKTFMSLPEAQQFLVTMNKTKGEARKTLIYDYLYFISAINGAEFLGESK